MGFYKTVRARGIVILPVVVVIALGSLLLYRTYSSMYAGIQLRQSVFREQRLAVEINNSHLKNIAGLVIDSAECVANHGALLCFHTVSGMHRHFKFNTLFEGPDSCPHSEVVSTNNPPPLSEIFSATTCASLGRIESFFTTRSNIQLSTLSLTKQTLLIASGGTITINGIFEVSGSVHLFAMGSVHIETLRIPPGALVSIFSLRDISVDTVVGGGTIKKIQPGNNSSQAVLPWLPTADHLLWSKRAL